MAQLRAVPFSSGLPDWTIKSASLPRTISSCAFWVTALQPGGAATYDTVLVRGEEALLRAKADGGNRGASSE